MMQYKAKILYDGSRYFGWQKTKTGPSIQESLEKAIREVTQERMTPEAASRTDRGVHAEGQVVAFSLKKDWRPEKLQQAIHRYLPPDIRIQLLEKTDPSFHPTLNAKEKEYHYRICLGEIQDPMQRLYSWHFHFPLDLEKMSLAALDLLGTHDFQAFANEKEENPLCTLSKITITPLRKERLQISLQGNRFLYKMARNIVGTLLYIGCGKLPSEIPSILRSKDRKQAGVTAPAHGLFLHRVDY